MNEAETTRTSAGLFLLMVTIVYVLAYAFRWVYLNYYLSTGVVLTDVNPEWNVITTGAFNQAFLISSLIFGAFLVVARPLGGAGSRAVLRTDYVVPNGWITLFFVLLVAFTLVVRRTYGTVLGEAPAVIPYGLGTPIYRSQADLIPGMFLLFAEAAWMTGARRNYAGWIAGLAIFNLLMALLTTSKAGLIYFAVQFVMLMYLTGQDIFAKPWRLALLALGGVLVFIVAAQLRSQALLGTDALILHSLREGRIVDTLLEVVGMIVNRLPGTEGLALYCGLTCTGLPDFTVPVLNGEAGRIFTQEVVNVRTDFDFRSPGFIGGAIIIGGLWGGALLAVAFLAFWLVLLRIADHFGLSAAFKVSLCFSIFRFILEGTWLWQDIASALAGAILVEAASRGLRRSASADLEPWEHAPLRPN